MIKYLSIRACYNYQLLAPLHTAFTILVRGYVMARVGDHVLNRVRTGADLLTMLRLLLTLVGDDQGTVETPLLNIVDALSVLV